MTVAQMRARSKWVTRRDVNTWQRLKVGDFVMAIEKGMGLKPGEKQVELYPIEIRDIRIEKLSDITPEDVVKEGFPTWTTEQFLEFFLRERKKSSGELLVRRIQFREVIPF